MSGAITATAIGGALQSRAAGKAADAQSAAAARAAEQAAFNPYAVEGGAFGGVGFQDGTAQLQMSPEMQAIQQQYQQQAGQFAGQGQTQLGALAAQGGMDFMQAGMGADPFATAQTQFGRMEDILAPGRQRQREALEGRLLKQGRLGSTGGALQQQGLEGAIEESRQRGLVDALGQGQAIQAQQLAQGQQLGLFGQQQEDVGFQQAQARLGALGGIDQQLLNYANLGSGLGGRQAAAGAQQGAFGMQGATSGTAALLGGAAGQAQALGQIGSAFGDMSFGGSTTGGVDFSPTGMGMTQSQMLAEQNF